MSSYQMSAELPTSALTDPISCDMAGEPALERVAGMSIQLILSHYLAGLRERNELDALLPELLKAMGHSVLSRPQIGPAQAGVDVFSTLADADGVEEVYVFIIKFGNVGRADLYGGPQSIDPSVREACNDFIRNRLRTAQTPEQENCFGLQRRAASGSAGGLCRPDRRSRGTAALPTDVLGHRSAHPMD